MILHLYVCVCIYVQFYLSSMCVRTSAFAVILIRVSYLLQGGYLMPPFVSDFSSVTNSPLFSSTSSPHLFSHLLFSSHFSFDFSSHYLDFSPPIRQADGTLLNSSATLYVTMLFQFSKVSPIRSRIYGIQDKLRAVEKELNRIKGGKEKENDVY